MMVKQFEEEYGEKGGIRELTKLRALLTSQDSIAAHFGVTKERVRQWLLEFFGNTYDPRSARKEAIMASMIEFAKHNSKEDFDAVFGKTKTKAPSEYYKEVLSECKKQKIYDSE